MARKLYGSPFAIVETVLRVRPRIAVGSLRRLLETAASLGMLGVLAGHFFVFSSCAGAGPLLVPRLDRSAGEMFAPLIEARVICRIYTQGRQRITEYCQDGYTCGDTKCLPGPEIRRQIEAEKARRLDALKKQQEELERAAKQLQELSQQARRDARRAEAAASSAPSSGGAYQPGSWYTPNGDPRNIPSPRYNRGSGGPYGGQSQRGPRPARNPSIPAKRLTLRDQLRYGFMIADLFKLRDTFSQGGNDWNNADDAIRNLDKKLLDQGIDLKSAFTDLYKPLEPQAGSGNAAQNHSPRDTAGAHLTSAGSYCEPDPADARHQISWQAASNGYCKKWRLGEDGRTLPSDYDPHDTDSFSDNIVNALIYTQPCPAGASQAYADALRSPAGQAATSERKPMFGDTFPQEECANNIADYMHGDIDLASVPDRCQAKLQETPAKDLGPDADEIEGIKKYFERGQLPPGAAGDAFGRPVGEVYGPPVPSVSPDGAQKHP